MPNQGAQRQLRVPEFPSCLKGLLGLHMKGGGNNIKLYVGFWVEQLLCKVSTPSEYEQQELGQSVGSEV